MATDPWAQFNPQAPAQAPAPQAPPSGPIYGAPDPNMPFKVEDQGMQRAGAARDAERLRIAQEAEARAARKHQVELEDRETGRGATEGERKAAAFLIRALGANKSYEGVDVDPNEAGVQGIGPRSYVGQVLADKAPNLLNTLHSSIGNSPERQVADTNQDEFIAASLRQDSGAAIPPEEMERQRRIYFPMPGDGPEAIAAKREARRRAIEGLKQSSGALLNPTLQRWDEMSRASKTVDQKSDFTEEELASGLTGSVTDTTPNMPDSPDGTTPPDGDGYWSQVGRRLAEGSGSVVEGLASIPGVVVDPLATTLGRALGYKDYTSNFGARVREDLGFPDNPDRFANAAIGGGSAALAGGGLARGFSTITNPGALRNAFTTLSRTPVRDVASGAGAGAGGYVGEKVGGVPGAIIGSMAGGIGGYKGADKLARQFIGERTPTAMMQAADEFGVKVLPADVGGVRTRMASGAVGRTLGGIPLAEGAEEAVASAGAARSRLAEGIGDVADEAGVGQATRRGFKEFAKSSKARADDLYGKVSVGADAKVQLANTRTALADVTRGMQSNPELSKLWANHPQLRATLEALTPQDVAPQGREAFIAASRKMTDAQTRYRQVLSAVSSPSEQVAARKALDAAQAEVEAAQKIASTPPKGGELSWQDMNRFRSIVGEVIGQPGVSRDGSDIAALRKLYGALSTDMEVTAARAGPKALDEFKKANRYWRGREKRIDDVFQGLFGNRDQKSDEAVFRQINSWAQARTGDFSRLARTIRSMPEDEANTVRATVIQRMGQAKPARQNATGEVFSPAEFSTQWNSLSDRAKNVLFPNKTHRQDLDKFSELMSGMKRATEYQNFSNTALGANLTGVGLVGMSGVPGMIAAAGYSGATFGLGKLLASPRFARAIATTAKLPPGAAARKFSEQLSVLATREPLLAADARGLQQYITEAMRQSPVRAAAGEEEADRRRKPVQ